MRSYNEVVSDVKKGIPVTKQEALYALQAASAMLFFKNQRLQQIAESKDNQLKRGMWIRAIESDVERGSDHISTNMPLDQYLGTSKVDELPEGSEELKAAREYSWALDDALSADKFDPAKVVGLWARHLRGG